MRNFIACFSLLFGVFSCSKTTQGIVQSDSGKIPTDDQEEGSGTQPAEDTGAQSEDDTARDDRPDCETTVDETWPPDGAMNHYYRDPIVFKLSEPDETATVLADVEGETTVSTDGLTITFMPAVPLEPSTSYTFTLDYCYGQPEITFSTSKYGADLEPSTDIQDAVYTLRFTDGEYTVGDNAGRLMNAVFQWPILVQLVDIDAPYLNLIAAIGKKDSDAHEQNTCARTLLIENIPTGTLPMLAGGLNDQVFGAHGGLLRFDSFSFDGTIAADGMTLGGIRYSASIGVAEIAALLPEFGDVDSVCILAENLDIPCEPCVSDEFELCIRVAAEHIEGVRVSTTLTPIEEAGVHDDCETEEED